MSIEIYQNLNIGTTYIRQSKVCRSNSGELYVVYTMGPPPNEYNVHLSYSSDNGATWNNQGVHWGYYYAGSLTHTPWNDTIHIVDHAKTWGGIISKLFYRPYNPSTHSFGTTQTVYKGAFDYVLWPKAHIRESDDQVYVLCIIKYEHEADRRLIIFKRTGTGDWPTDWTTNITWELAAPLGYQNNEFKSILIGSEIHVIYEERIIGTSDKKIKYAIFNTITESWNTPVSIDNNIYDNKEAPHFFEKDTSGNLIVSWLQTGYGTYPSKRQIIENRKSGGSWGSPTNITDNNYDVGGFVGGAGPDDKLAIVYNTGEVPDRVFEGIEYDGLSWGDPHGVYSKAVDKYPLDFIYGTTGSHSVFLREEHTTWDLYYQGYTPPQVYPYIGDETILLTPESSCIWVMEVEPPEDSVGPLPKFDTGSSYSGSWQGVYGAILIPETGGGKGPIDKPYLCTSVAEFLRIFSPNDRVEINYSLAYFSALTYLQQKDSKLWVLRVPNSARYGGCVLGKENTAQNNEIISLALRNIDDYEFSTNDQSIVIVGSNPGSWNNDISIQLFKYYDREYFIADHTTDELSVNQYWSTGIEVVLTSTDTLPHPLTEERVYYIINVDENTIKLAKTKEEAIAGTAIDLIDSGIGIHQIDPFYKRAKESDTFLIEVYKNSETKPVEQWTCSKDEGKRSKDGQNLYLEVVLEKSNYIRGYNNKFSTGYPKEQVTKLNLGRGSDGYPVRDGHMIHALSKFMNRDDIPITLFLDGGWVTPSFQSNLIELCQSRKDCVPIISTPYNREVSSDAVNELVDYRRQELNVNTSYGGLFSPHIKIYDKYNDRYIYTSPDGFVASAIFSTNANYDIWFPAAGKRRGKIEASDLSKRFKSGEMDLLVDAGINPIRFVKGQGLYIWSYKSLLNKPSSLDRLNVRLLNIYIAANLAEDLENFTFEVNDETSRRTLQTLLEAKLENIKARKGIYEYKVICDNTNNPASAIDNHELVVWLFIKPIRYIEFINFNLSVTKTGFTVEPV